MLSGRNIELNIKHCVVFIIFIIPEKILSINLNCVVVVVKMAINLDGLNHSRPLLKLLFVLTRFQSSKYIRIVLPAGRIYVHICPDAEIDWFSSCLSRIRCDILYDDTQLVLCWFATFLFASLLLYLILHAFSDNCVLYCKINIILEIKI